jgi:tetratricopeptide (TPR) repeat protein
VKLRRFLLPIAAAMVLTTVFSVPAATAFDLAQRRWCALGTSQFDLISDLPPEEALGLLEQLNRFDQVAGRLLYADGAPATPRLKVIVFRDRGDFEKVFDSPSFAGFMSASIHDNLLSVGPDAAGEHLVENLLHEYVHHVLRNDPQGVWPLWYEEGLASFFATIQVDNGAALLGAATKHQPERLHRSGGWREVRVRLLESPTSLKEQHGAWLRELLDAASMRDGQEAIGDFYQRSWLLVHLLRMGHHAGFADRRAHLKDYLARLRRGERSQAAFVAAMGESLTEVARDLERYRERRRFPTVSVPVETPATAPVDARGCLEPSQVAYELGMASSSINPAFARDAFDWLIETSSDDPRAYVGYSVIERAQGEFREAWRSARYAIRLDQHNVRARVEMATAMVEACREDHNPDCQRQWRHAAELYTTALAAEPERADANFGLGVVQFLLGHPEDAIPALQRAHRTAPWAPRISLFLGEAYRLAGDVEQASWHLARALRWEVEPEWQLKAEAAVKLLPRKSG